MKRHKDIQLLDAFAQAFAGVDDLVCSNDQPLPDSLVDSAASDDWNSFRWKPVKLTTPRESIDSLRIYGRLPALFESFALAYAWLDVDLKVCRLFANPPAVDLLVLSNAMFADPVMNKALLTSRFVRFGLAPDGCYDPICFDLNAFDGDDCPIVRLEHEAILVHNRIGKRETLFDSFRDLMLTVVELSAVPRGEGTSLPSEPE